MCPPKRLEIEFPRLFKCNKCNVFFFTFSKLDKPTHPKCFGHNTRSATKEEIEQINITNKTSFRVEQNE